jgi:hypothetical protein
MAEITAEFNVNVEGLPPGQRKEKFAREVARQVNEDRKRIILARVNEMRGTSFATFQEMEEACGDAFKIRATGADFPVSMFWLDGKPLGGFIPPIIKTTQREDDPHTADCNIKQIHIPADATPDSPDDLLALHKLLIDSKMTYVIAKMCLPQLT